MSTSATERPVDSRDLVKDTLAFINDYFKDASSGNLPNAAMVRQSFKELRERSKRVCHSESAYDIGEVMNQASNALSNIIITFETARIKGDSPDDASIEALKYVVSLEEWSSRYWC